MECLLVWAVASSRRWSPAQAVQSILWKELFAIVNSVNTWDHQWAKQQILLHCDNKAVVYICCKGSTCDPGTMALVRLLPVILCCSLLIITHISSSDNCIADFLSRFQALAPEAQPSPDPIHACRPHPS